MDVGCAPDPGSVPCPLPLATALRFKISYLILKNSIIITNSKNLSFALFYVLAAAILTKYT